MSSTDDTESLFLEERRKPTRPLRLRDGGLLDHEVSIRTSRLNPGHRALVAADRGVRGLPDCAEEVEESRIDLTTCRFCHPDALCAEAPEERETLKQGDRAYILARTPYYYLPGHGILFPDHGPHRLADAGLSDWEGLIEAGIEAARRHPEYRCGFNAGTYLCSGGSQRHLHLQLFPFEGATPSETMLIDSLKGVTPDCLSFEALESAFAERGLVVDRIRAPRRAFLAASWAPKFNLEMVAFLSKESTDSSGDPGMRDRHRPRFRDLDDAGARIVARWIHETARRFVVPRGGGLNGFVLEVPGLPMMVRLVPRLPGAVQAFMETGAGLMVIQQPPESLPGLWNASSIESDPESDTSRARK